MIRKAVESDIDVIETILMSTINNLKELNIPQWQSGYPNRDNISCDIQQGKAYVYDNNGVKAYFYLCFDGEKTYDEISATPYGVIHRVFVDINSRNQGIGQQLFNFAKVEAKKKNSDLFIDTHKDNIIMNKLIKNNNFKYLREITVSDGTLRLAYKLDLLI